MLLTRLATLLCWGVAAYASQTPAAPKQAPPKGPAPAQAATQAAAPAPAPPQTDEERVAKLRKLVESAEKALDSEEEDTAFDRSDEAEVLLADWSEDLLQRPDVQILLERLKGVQNQVPEGGIPGTPKEGRAREPEAGLKEPEQVTILKGSDLSREQAKVQAAEQGTTYDFPIDLNDKVLTWVRLFTTEKRGYIERSLERGSAYFPMIRQVFAEEGVPQDLAYLGFVESGYINQAKSYARAVGMWQFMPSTGRLFGLKINRWMDERRDPVKATHAAARYLKRLYETSGDWYLALVGYNAGPLTTQRAEANLGSANFWDMYRSPYLRNQTKNYVPEMCAAVLIARNPESYGFRAASEAPFVYETVEVRSATSLRVVARFAGVSEATIRDLNPQLLRGTTPPGAYELRVPVGRGLEVQRRLGGHPATHAQQEQPPEPTKPLEGIPAIPLSQPQPPVPSASAGGDTYRARPGDTLAKIARAQGVSFSELLRLNPEAAEHLSVGDSVRLPAAPGPQVHGGPGLRPRFYTVQRGDTLASLSEQFGVSISDLKHWNRLRSGRLQAGRRLWLVAR